MGLSVFIIAAISAITTGTVVDRYNHVENNIPYEQVKTYEPKEEEKKDPEIFGVKIEKVELRK